MRAILIAAAMLAALAGSGCAAESPEAPLVRFPGGDLIEQRIEGADLMRVPMPPFLILGAAEFEITVGSDGRVAALRQIEHAHDGTAPVPVAEAVRRWLFRPFEFEGRPVAAVGRVRVQYTSPERWSDRNAPFPDVDYDRLRIVIERTACGMCSSLYRVEIAGDGSVRLTSSPEPNWGNPDFRPLLVPGDHRWRIPRAEVEALVERFRAARFFGMAERYESGGSHRSPVTLTFDSGRGRKSVFDYIGENDGRPDALAELWEAVDRAAGTARWTVGTADTAAALAGKGFDFTSAEAGRMLLGAGRFVPETMFLQFLDRGAALERRFAHEGRPPAPLGRLLLERAVNLGNERLVARLASAGWLDRVPDAELSRWFYLHVSGCSPAIAEALVRAGASPDARDEEERRSALHRAVEGSHICLDRPHRQRLAFIRALVRLGADPNGRDRWGSPPLSVSEHPDFTRLLLALGARIDIVGEEGSPLFWTDDDRIALILLRAGADPRQRKPGDGYTVRQVAREKGFVATLRWLDERGIP
jgi:hypothetical protein